MIQTFCFRVILIKTFHQKVNLHSKHQLNSKVYKIISKIKWNKGRFLPLSPFNLSVKFFFYLNHSPNYTSSLQFNCTSLTMILQFLALKPAVTSHFLYYCYYNGLYPLRVGSFHTQSILLDFHPLITHIMPISQQS